VSTAGWIILLVLLLPIIGILIWIIIIASVVRVPSGSLGLLMVKGKATDTTLPPGTHFIFALRRRMVEEYPSVELAYRAGARDAPDPDAPGAELRRSSQLEQSGPALTVILGDRTTAVVSFTVRFVPVPERLRTVHERFGPTGLFGIVRDESIRTVRNTLGEPAFGVESLFGPAREASQTELAAAVGAALEAAGIRLTAFMLGMVDLGRTGEVIGATVRARYELDRETAEAATRLARALNDVDLQGKLTSSGEAGWRYRETDLWRELVQRTGALEVSLRPTQPGNTTVDISEIDEPGPDNEAESGPAP
jgi:SPFH domain / Band 7 family